MWKSIIFTLLQPSGELYITESIKASRGRVKGATVVDEFAFSLGHLKDRTCSISVSSSWNWNGNGKQCLKLCIELRWGAESSRRHQAVIAPHAKTQQCFLSPHYRDWMTEVKRAQDFSKQHPEAQMNGRNTCELLNQLRWDLFSCHFKSSSTNSNHMLSQPF